jgi:hypothetical protein
MLIASTSAFSLPALSDPPIEGVLTPKTTVPTQTKKDSAVRDFGSLPLSFEGNQGQTDAKVRFLTHSGNSTLFLTPSEAVFAMTAQPSRQSKRQSSLRKGQKAPRSAEKIVPVVLRMQLVGSDPNASVLQQQPLAGRINYFIGKDPSKWHAGVPTFGRVGFHEVYSGVDLVYYGNQRHLEYDFVVAPHADPGQIKLHFAGAQGVHLNAAGDLVVRTESRELKWQQPVVYQQDTVGKHRVAARFRLRKLPDGETSVSFAIDRYNTERTLIIDPKLLYSTYLGGATQYNTGDEVDGIAVDSSGNAYLTGALTSFDFPTTPGAFQTTHGNIFVTKLNPTGTALVYSTLLGGANGGLNLGKAIAIDSAGNTYVTGFAQSDFPTTIGAFQPRTFNSADSFLLKLNPTGTALVYSTFLGGSALTDTNAIAVDSGGNAYVVGSTDSFDFPVTSVAFQKTFDPFSGRGCFVTKFNPTGTALVYSTFLSGSGNNQARGISVDSNGSAYVVGSTDAADFPVTPGAFQTVNHATGIPGGNGFVTKFDPTGSSLIYSTFIGGSVQDTPSAITNDLGGNTYIVGVTKSLDFPMTPGAFRTVGISDFNSYASCFVTKLNPTGTALVYSTFLTGTASNPALGPFDAAGAIAVDNVGNAYVVGLTDSVNFPITPGAVQRAGSAFLAKLNSTGTRLIYSTFLGGIGDYARGVALGSDGNAYVTGSTLSSTFPTTPGAFQTANHAASGRSNGFVTKLPALPIFSDFNNDGFTDLFIQNSSTNVIASWFMQGSTWVGGAYFSLTPPSDYALVGAGDFSGNGATTLVLQSRITNQVAFWYTSGVNNATIPGGHFVNVIPDAGWKVVGVGDFNGDGKSDLVLQNQTTNQVAIWFMNGANYAGGVLMPFTPPAGWTVAGVGDFNVDGFSDIAFQNQATGQIALWYMNGPTYVGGTVLTTVPASGWKVVGVGDYNGDGSADLLFQNQTSNQAAVWYLTNGAFAGGVVLSLIPPTGWKIVGPR